MSQRNPPRRRRVIAALAAAAACGFAVHPCARADLRVWDGGGANNSWSNASNWASFFGAPANDGTDDIIMQGVIRPTPLVDIDFDILSLQFSGGGGAGPFVISNASGAELTIRGGGIINNDMDLQVISRMRLGANHTWNAAAGPLQVNFVTLGGLTTGRALTVAGGFDTSVQGIISGSPITGAGSIILNSTANFTIAGFATQHNTFTGPVIVNSGTLRLNKPAGITAIPGNLIIGDGVGTDLVRLFQDNQIADTSNVTINSSGLLHLNARSEMINNLTINGGGITTAGGSLVVNGNLSATGGNLAVGPGAIRTAGSISITGSTVSIESGTLSFGSASSISSSVVNGSFSLLKGVGTLTVSNSTMSATDVSLGGHVAPRSVLDLTAATLGRVANAGTLDSSGVIDVFVRASSTPTIVGNLYVPATDLPDGGGSRLTIEDGPAPDDMILQRVFALGASQRTTLYKAGAGQLRLEGQAEFNEFRIGSGTVIMDTAVPSGAKLFVGVGTGNAVLRFEERPLSDVTTEVTVGEGGVYDLNGFVAVMGPLRFRGGAAMSGTGSLTTSRIEVFASPVTASLSGRARTGLIEIADGAAAVDMDVPAVIVVAGGTISGPGTLRLSGANEIGGSLTVEGGATVLAANDQALGTAAVTINGSTLTAAGAPRTLLNSITMLGNSGISGEQTLTLNGSFGIAMNATLTKSGAATLALSGPQAHGSGSSLDVNDGAVRIGNDAGLNLTINLNGSGARTDFLARQHIAGLNVNAGQAIIETGGSRGVVAKALTVDTTDALIDIWEHAVIADYTDTSPLASIKSAITTAYNGGSWTGFGITSSLANGSTHGVGYAESGAVFASFPATFVGEAVDDTAVLVRVTRYGDANLDQVVNLSDFNALAANFGQSNRFWWHGDFNYDGSINLQDFNRLAANFGLTAAGPDVTPKDWAALASAIPEPATVALLALLPLASGLGRVRRRRQLRNV